MPLTQLSALADPTRRAIFERLAEAPSSVGSLADRLPVSRPAVSQHLRVLSDAGLVDAAPTGTRRVYSVRPDGLAELGSWLEEMWDTALDGYERAAMEEIHMETKDTRSIPAVVKTRTVPLPIERAFALFTEGIGSWWPMETHSIAAGETGSEGVTVRFEGRVGGRVVEIGVDGSECAWAEVTAWHPPERFVLSWHPNREPKAATVLEVRFTPHPDGTQIHLVHRGWEEFGDEATDIRAGYATGWDMVLERFVDV